jgi:hypothetical protein
VWCAPTRLGAQGNAAEACGQWCQRIGGGPGGRCAVPGLGQAPGAILLGRLQQQGACIQIGSFSKLKAAVKRGSC